MSCANFQELLAGQGAATATDFTPANIDFPYDSDDDLRLDIYNYEDQVWVNVPLATGATIDVGGAGDVFYAWETYLTNGQTGVRTILATAGTTPALPAGGTASHPLAPANNNYPVEGGTGVNVRLYRQTSIEAGELPAYFYPGASIRAQDLNDNFEALRKVVEEGACSTNNITDGSAQLDARYWNKLDDTLEQGDAWVSDDAHIATTAAGDARWLNATGGNVVGGDGIDVAEAGGNITISVDLDDVSGLEFDGGELRIDTNLGCEIVANGLNTQTTAASVVQTGGTDANPAIRISETLGATTTNTDLVITGGANTTVTRNSNGELTIASSGGTGLTYRGTVDVTDNATLPTDSNVNDVYANDTEGTQTAEWQAVITGASTTANQGDLLLCSTAAGGTAADARYTLIESGTDVPAATTPNLQAVTGEGNTTTNAIILDDTSLQIQEGADTLTVNWPTGSADRTISFPDAAGTVALAGDVPAAANNGALTITAGTNITAALTGGQFTADKADATTITLDVDDVFVLTAGDTMTGNLQMDGASVIADNGENVPDADGNWDIQNSNVWQVANGRTIEFPDNSDAPIPGQTGIFVCAGTVAGWTNANGGTWEHPGGTQQAGNANGALIPFYVQTATNIILGTQTVGS